MIGLAAAQRRFLVGRSLAPENAEVEQMRKLLQEALNYVVFMPFSAGVMTRFEHALYAEGLPGGSLNAKWWELVRRYQGVAPPAPRDESTADALTKGSTTWSSSRARYRWRFWRRGSRAG